MTIMVTWHPLVGGFVNFLFAMFDWAAMQYLIYAHLLGDSIGYGLLFFLLASLLQMGVWVWRRKKNKRLFTKNAF